MNEEETFWKKYRWKIIGLILLLLLLLSMIVYYRRRRAGKLSNNGIQESTIDFVKNLTAAQSTFDLIGLDEGDVLTVYLDENENPTVGYGHLVLAEDNLNVGDKITEAQAKAFLALDLAAADSCIKSDVKVPLNQNQYDALISLVYQQGCGAFKKSRTLQLINSGASQQDISDEWISGWDVEFQKRRLREIKLYFS